MKSKRKTLPIVIGLLFFGVQKVIGGSYPECISLRRHGIVLLLQWSEDSAKDRTRKEDKDSINIFNTIVEQYINEHGLFRS